MLSAQASAVSKSHIVSTIVLVTASVNTELCISQVPLLQGDSAAVAAGVILESLRFPQPGRQCERHNSFFSFLLKN